MDRLKLGLFLLIELLLKLIIGPRLRARLLVLFGATVGRNVRIYSCSFINLRRGFKNFTAEDDVHIGTGCLIDLEGPVRIGKGTTISPRVIILSHSDPGAAHSTPLLDYVSKTKQGVLIGEYCWIGSAATLLDGSRVADMVIVGAMSLVRGELHSQSIYAGVPVRRVRALPVSVSKLTNECAQSK